MKTQRFLIATEGTFDGRQISAEAIRSILANFIAGGVTLPVVYDFYDWSPALSEVVALAVDSDGEKMRLYAEVCATEELQQMAVRHVDYFFVPAIMSTNECDTTARLVSVGLTKDPLIPGLDKMQFCSANHAYRVFSKPKNDGNTHCIHYYRDGAHAGNVYLRVEGWGMNSQAVEDEVIRLVSEFIKGLNFKRNFSCGTVEISCAHPLTAKQIAEWVQLKEQS
ncbi:TPA: hypothetical protein KEY07_003056 [Citrobacter freundii]|nr:hypothetical protein [Salmonella enterica]EFP4758133.1 hypothetical protein [Salmonella enterica]EFP4790132.1 hypothetical protein [Salmonella enterica]HBC7087890.1 hypothetical protein [Citrobacter freundii]